MATKNIALMVMLVVVSALSLGCASQRVGTSSSVVDYLYSSDQPKPQQTKPHLSLPLKIGIAFVPESKGGASAYFPYSNQSYSATLSEAKKLELLEKVSNSFTQLEFVEEISVIPTGYLRANGGFQNLDQLSAMYDIDVIALVSYDQLQFIDQDYLSITYWTLVGAYLVKGEKNDTSTLMDTAVYDIASRSLLFRAPGNSTIKGRSTPVSLSQELREDSYEGFNQAANDMQQNLALALETFQAKLKKNPELAQVSRRSGYSGSGAASPVYVLLILLFVAFRRLYHQSGNNDRGTHRAPSNG